MLYKNGKTAQLKDRVVVFGNPAGIYIGNVADFHGDLYLQVHPMFNSSSFLVEPANAILVTDALPGPLLAPPTPGAMKPAEVTALKSTAVAPAEPVVPPVATPVVPAKPSDQ
jgi:hypothetical protein